MDYVNNGLENFRKKWGKDKVAESIKDSITDCKIHPYEKDD
jgi:hypothetical protein